MSDTPNYIPPGSPEWQEACIQRMAKLERELAEAKSQAAVWRTGAHNVVDGCAALKAERDQWREVAEELSDIAAHIGWTSVEDGGVIKAAERARERFRKLKESS